MPLRERVRSTYTRVRPWVPAVAFIGGFVWDAVTLGKVIKPADLFILLGYLAGAAGILILIGRRVTFRGSQYLNAGLQFLFGGIFSALFIFYFLSSSDLAGYLVVAALAALLVGNEFLERAYSRLTLSWALFALSALMFFNFALAHLFRSISTFWFYLGTVLAVLLVVWVRRAAGRVGDVRPAIGVAVLMIVLHAFNAIPPVPLVKKEMLIAHSMRKAGGGYVARVEPPPFWMRWRMSSPTFHRAGGEPVYCFTSVFIPEGISTTIRHRWQFFDERRDAWTEAGRVAFRIEGGRRTGYRGFTLKRNVVPGRWRVIAEAESGAAIGMTSFQIEAEPPKKLKDIKL